MLHRQRAFPRSVLTGCIGRMHNQWRLKRGEEGGIDRTTRHTSTNTSDGRSSSRTLFTHFFTSKSAAANSSIFRTGCVWCADEFSMRVLHLVHQRMCAGHNCLSIRSSSMPRPTVQDRQAERIPVPFSRCYLLPRESPVVSALPQIPARLIRRLRRPAIWADLVPSAHHDAEGRDLTTSLSRLCSPPSAHWGSRLA